MSQNGNSGYIYSALNSVVQITRKGIHNWTSLSSKPTNPSKFGFPDDSDKPTKSTDDDPYANIIVRDIAPEPEDEERVKVYLSKEFTRLFNRLPSIPTVPFKPKGVASALGILTRYTARVGTKHFFSEKQATKKYKEVDVSDLSFHNIDTHDV